MLSSNGGAHGERQRGGRLASDEVEREEDFLDHVDELGVIGGRNEHLSDILPKVVWVLVEGGRVRRGENHPAPRVINTDKHAGYPPAIQVLKEEGALPAGCEHRAVRYLNNVLEQDHRAIKRRVKASSHFRAFGSAAATVGTYNATTSPSGLSGPLGLAGVGNNLFVANYTAGTVGEYNAATGATINASFIIGVTGDTYLFTPVPKPSTWVVSGVGMGLLGLTLCRLRRASRA